jgi:methanogenic corrinoid protein MtbC1
MPETIDALEKVGVRDRININVGVAPIGNKFSEQYQ